MAMRTNPILLLENFEDRIKRDSSHLNNYITDRKNRGEGGGGAPALRQRPEAMRAPARGD
jgi:hypothetical protein